MTEKTGRNDPCPCGSGKKYKACCWGKAQPGRKKFKATVLSQAPRAQAAEAPVDTLGDSLMERVYGDAMKTKKPMTALANAEEETNSAAPKEEK